MPKPRNKKKIVHDPSDSNLGLMFYLRDGAFKMVDTVPITFEQAEDFIIQSQMMNSIMVASRKADAPPTFFIPLSAFHPIKRTGADAENLQEQMDASLCNCPICQYRRGQGLG